ncbi:MAG: hypothetical protein LQ340_004675 [Diploschistes diacapsis]|nr:MAG: hypothetical protein LQ340_004675 [Diploschistes diacapsis]
MFALLEFPSEILDHVFSFLSPVSLGRIASTCRTINHHVNNDLYWRKLLQDIVASPAPYATWKDLYVAHYPYWFLPQQKIWFSDKATIGNSLIGQLILARYDGRTGNIEGYRLVAEHPSSDVLHHWKYDTDVLIHEFHPKVHLFLDDPILKLEADAYRHDTSRLKQEISISPDATRRADANRASIFPAIRIPPRLQDRSMQLWPPQTIPATDRVRTESSTLFMDEQHKPSTPSFSSPSFSEHGEMATTAFRIRKWMAFLNMSERLSLRMAEDVMTWATLPESCYVPTTTKPYQGIWVGDYNDHGCEFLVVIQRTLEEAQRMEPVRTDVVRTQDMWLAAVINGATDSQTPAVTTSASSYAAAVSWFAGSGSGIEDAEREEPGETGRLDAIKLTGDPHVPRGQPSWIAEDIGRRGEVRVADDDDFRGSRIVKSHGHIAARGFMSGTYASPGSPNVPLWAGSDDGDEGSRFEQERGGGAYSVLMADVGSLSQISTSRRS